MHVKTWILMMTFGDVHPIPTGGLIIKKRKKTCTFHQTKPIWIAGTIPFVCACVSFWWMLSHFSWLKVPNHMQPTSFWRRGFTFFDGCHVPSSYLHSQLKSKKICLFNIRLLAYHLHQCNTSLFPPFGCVSYLARQLQPWKTLNAWGPSHSKMG